MARGKTFQQVITATLAEAGISTNSNQSRNIRDSIEQTVQRTYERLHGDFPWIHLQVYRDKTLQAGKRYYAFPDDLDPDRLHYVWTLEAGGTTWRAVGYGIGPDEWNTFNPDQDERSGPVKRWEVYDDQGQFEVWPIPEVNDGLVRFHGVKKPKSLTANSDTVDLDDQLVALYAAAEWLQRQNNADAQMKLEQGLSRYQRLRAQQSSTDPVFAMNPTRRRRDYGWPDIHVRAPE